jgi:hypothetical protein
MGRTGQTTRLEIIAILCTKLVGFNQTPIEKETPIEHCALLKCP